MNEKFFQLKPRLKKDIKEKVFEAKAIFEVEAEGRDLEMVRGCHFLNRETQGKKSNYTRKYF